MGAPWQLLVASSSPRAGVGIGYAAMPTLILDAVPAREAASAVGVNALMRSVGTTLAAAVMATCSPARPRSFGGFLLPTEGAFQACFVVGAVAAFVGVAIAGTIPRRRGADADARTSSPRRCLGDRLSHSAGAGAGGLLRVRVSRCRRRRRSSLWRVGSVAGIVSPSTEMWGRILSSQPGSHHAALPNSTIDGRAERHHQHARPAATAVARPTPNCLIVGSPLRMKLANTDAMIRAAAVVIRALDARPEADRLPRLLALVVVAVDVADQEDLVVHRQAEQPGEHHQRHVAGDRHRRVGGVDAEQRDPPAPLEGRGQHAEGGGRGQQVGDRRLQRDEQRAERDHQQDEAEQDDGADHQQQPRGDQRRPGRRTTR